MLKCIVCGKVIANTDPSTVRYGGCASCPLEDVRTAMLVYKYKGLQGGMLGGQKKEEKKEG